MKRIKVNLLNTVRRIFMFRVLEHSISKLVHKNTFMSPFFSKLAPNNYQYKQKTFRDFEIDSIKLKLDISDYLGHYIYFGIKDLSLIALLELVQKNIVVLDVGANIGYTALRMASITGTNGTIHAFEPDPYNFEQLTKNTNLNSYLPIKTYNVGLGIKQSKLKLAINTPDNFGGNRIKEDAVENFNWVNIITIDSFVETNNIGKVNLIKIDVEGFEYNVLKGAEKVLEKHRPILFIELDDDNLKQQNSSAKDLIQFVAKYYHTITNAETKNRITSDLNFSHCHYDIICKN